MAGVLDQRGGARHADARDRTRRFDSGRRRRDLARHRCVGIRQGGRLSPRPRKRELDRDALAEMLSAGAPAIRFCRSRTRSPKTTTKGFERFTAAVGDRIQVIGDDYLVTSAGRVREAARRRSVNAVLIKVNQAGTVSEAKAASTKGAAQASERSSRRVRARPRTFDRSSCDRLGRRATQGRLVRALRADGEMERGAAHRGGAGRKGALRRARRVSRAKGSLARPRRPEPPPFVWRHQASRSRALMTRSGTVKTINIISILTSLPRVTVQEFWSLLQSPWTAAIFTWRANPCPRPSFRCADSPLGAR